MRLLVALWSLLAGLVVFAGRCVWIGLQYLGGRR